MVDFSRNKTAPMETMVNQKNIHRHGQAEYGRRTDVISRSYIGKMRSNLHRVGNL
jgi:hypothetical protein